MKTLQHFGVLTLVKCCTIFIFRCFRAREMHSLQYFSAQASLNCCTVCILDVSSSQKCTPYSISAPRLGSNAVPFSCFEVSPSQNCTPYSISARETRLPIWLRRLIWLWSLGVWGRTAWTSLGRLGGVRISTTPYHTKFNQEAD